MITMTMSVADCVQCIIDGLTKLFPVASSAPASPAMAPATTKAVSCSRYATG